MFKFDLTIITVVKNDELNISKTIESIISQKEKVNLQYIIIDGKSSDKTFEKIKKYRKYIDVLISKKDKGIYDAMNKGIRLSKGEIIGFCNSGDILYPGGLDIILKTFNNKKCDYVFGTILRNYKTSKIKKYGIREKRIYYNFDFATSHSTGFYVKKIVIDNLGLFNLKFKCSSDYDFYYRLIDSKKYTGSSTPKNKIIGEMSSGGFSSKLSFYQHLKEESYIRIYNKQNIFIVMVIFFNAIIKNFLKKINFF